MKKLVLSQTVRNYIVVIGAILCYPAAAFLGCGMAEFQHRMAREMQRRKDDCVDEAYTNGAKYEDFWKINGECTKKRARGVVDEIIISLFLSRENKM